ncbi:MAG: elongation factor P maturation arginine rhamnosyltransferase EarP [Zetaproteobacteria bacterium CG_4_9_14_3_um_filter_49_83]|nr:MAG: hypothetical protein AUJ56_07495 [Zetaproteobacteria bacterium CG1_02_49_23]PIQ31244.1 MAG: elongation factor P maturation arginine rhamnosyltransferase EarP [Zetaproteobacteria bacterium CG17_big_fil_post_rev_8_21_14_2_50_50_13]PIY55550.1 MAG: elongation factor P maturation arginine rhamnosyltransferase EarP [Zetaproteobacteria bacterium CG_4_10_14_0_8_um_filter_49_80]PJA35124.1 MAG: elongation factor P maturation arginine rhamnosyltransferase EarP [Zetaproteobacteria bacterium CG_4_9_1
MQHKPHTTQSTQRWDIFCNVVDNYGDIGVCWRLARQLATEFDITVRLWVDDLHSFARLHPAANIALDAQHCLGVEIHRWLAPFPTVDSADVVIDGFGCLLPQTYLATMAQRFAKPVWLNLEYLSAESWVNGCHGLPSPRPELNLTRHFFFPGFTPATGGLLLEAGLLEHRDALRTHHGTAFWSSLSMPQPQTDALKISLFCYENNNIPHLLSCWAEGERQIICMVPEGRALPQVLGWLKLPAAVVGEIFQRGNLEIRLLPFMAQQRYDELLWLCDVNFVRGEDSFVRAGWAARPMVWHIYPQDAMAHREKLAAFLALYTAELDAEDAEIVRRFWQAWNSGTGANAAWPGFTQVLQRLEIHARQWCTHLSHHGGGSLAANLIAFVQRTVDDTPPNLRGPTA